MGIEAVLKEQPAGRGDRAAARRSLKLHTSTHSPAGGDVLALIHNISPSGLLLEAIESALVVGDTFVIDLPEAGSTECTVVWASGRFFGCEFRRPVTKAAVSAAVLRGEPQLGSASPAIANARSDGSRAVGQSRLVPERNFLAAVVLALGLWGLIGAAAYLAVW